MIKILYTFVFLLCSTVISLAQETNNAAERDTLFEKATMGLVRFYFDDHYFLVDKDCEFKAIERLSAFLVRENAFDGPFKDFNRSGTLILTGNYNKGVKDGLFTAYHPNGATKWMCAFKDDKPTGDWKYFYPDGKPMLNVNYDSTMVKLTDYWDRRGKQEVIAGKGIYEFMMPFDFYNEFGYPYFIRKGRVKNGMPTGYWTTVVTDGKKNRELFAEEVFNEHGIMTEGYNLLAAKEIKVPFSILPANHFETAEQIIYKPCSFDAYSGYDAYLVNKFNSMALATVKFNKELKSSEHPFSFLIDLDDEGIPTGINFNKKTEHKSLNNWITALLKEIPYYFPTLNGQGQPIEGQVTVSGILRINEEGNSYFPNVQVER